MRFLILLLSAFAVLNQAAAQTLLGMDEEQVFFGGVHAGTNFSQVDGDGFAGYHKVGFTGGATVYTRISHFFAASLSLDYTQKGSVEKNFTETTIGPALFEYRIHLNYVEMPLQLHFFQGPHWNFGLGVAYARLLNWKEEAYSNNPIRITPELYPFKKQEWSWRFAIGYQFYKNWIIGGHYQYTLGNIREGDAIPPGFGGGTQRNNVVSLQLTMLVGTGLNDPNK